MTAVPAERRQYSAELLADLALVADEISHAFSGMPEPENLPLLHPLGGQGKLLRPAVVLAASHFAPAPPPERIDVAAAAELLHMASLIHDDIIDTAETRRGRPTLNAGWGASIAVLTGDIYSSCALARLAQLADTHYARLFLTCAADMSRSELRQTLARFDPGQSQRAYLASISGKTASLFAACARAGGLLADLCPGGQESLATYGWSLGMAFQLADDIADLSGGRPEEEPGQDIRSGIWTLPVLHCLESRSRRRIYPIIASASAVEELPAIRTALRESGSIAYAIDQARSFCNQARAALGALPSDTAAAALLSVVERVERDLADLESTAS